MDQEDPERAMSIRVPESQHRQLRALYVATGRSMKSMINEAIQEWLARQEKENGTDPQQGQ